MNNNEFKFISYKEYPDDQWIAGIAHVKMAAGYILAIPQRKKKEGGTYWDIPSISVTEHGEKKNVKIYKSMEDDLLLDFIKDGVKRYQVNSVTQMSGSAFVAPQATQGGGSPDEPLPF